MLMIITQQSLLQLDNRLYFNALFQSRVMHLKRNISNHNGFEAHTTSLLYVVNEAQRK